MTRSALEPIDYYPAGAWLPTVQERQAFGIEMLQAVLPEATGRVLDVGCGDGMFLAELDRRTRLSALGWELHGVDYSAAMIAEAQKRPYSFQQCNLEEGIPYPAGTFQVVTAGELIEHMYNPDHLLHEVHRVLSDGGHLLLTTPNLQAWYNRALFLLGIQPLFYEVSTKSTMIGAGPVARLKRGTQPVGHLRVFNRRGLLDLLVSEGFRPLAMRGAVFEALPRSVQHVDRLFNRWTSLASNLVVVAEKR